MIFRRTVLGVLTLALLAAPLTAKAQPPPRVYRIGLLLPTSAAEFAPRLDAFRQALREGGYVEGENVLLEPRGAASRPDRLPEFAAELVQLKVDVIVAWSTPSALAAKRATSSIPIVMATAGDPVGVGLVTSLARPGGNVTGNAMLLPELGAKRLELLKGALPTVSRVAILSNPANSAHMPMLSALKSTAKALGIQLVLVESRDAAGLASALLSATSGGATALMVLDDGVALFPLRARIANLALKNRLPAIAGSRDEAEAGYLMAYGTSTSYALDRQAAVFVTRILKGAKPADLPVELPTKFELVINLKTAKALGLTIPPSVLARADEVIE